MRIRNIIKLVIYPFTSFFYLISGLINRDSKIWVFGAQHDTFIDNTKHLFIYLTTNRPDIKAIWITTNRGVINKIRQNGGLAYYRWSFRGIGNTMLAKYWFVTTTVAEIDYYTSKGATVVNLWHGVPLKKIYFDTDNVEDFKRYYKASFLQRKIYEPFTYRLSDYVISTSNLISNNSMSTALKVASENCLNFGQARTDIFFFDDKKLDEWVMKWESDLFISIIKKARQANYVWIYMPTWREDNPFFLENVGIDYDKINEALFNKGELLIMKLHPYTPIDILYRLRNYSNIVVVESSQDIYPLLKYTDTLITDYSSIYIDYLILNMPIVYFCFDLEDFTTNSRGFYYNYFDVTPGVKVYSSKDLEEIIVSTVIEESRSKERSKTNSLFYDYMDGKSSKRIAEFFSQIE